MVRKLFRLIEAILAEKNFTEGSRLTKDSPRCSPETLRMLEQEAEHPLMIKFPKFPAFNGILCHGGLRYLVKFAPAW